jgi:lipopolysaccharide export system protein LptC
VGERLVTWFAVALLGIVLATSYWYSLTLERGGAAAAHGGGIDFFAEGVVLTTYDPQGRPHYQLHAERLTHFGADDSAELVRPRLLGMQPGRPAMQAQAAHGRALDGVRAVELDGGVELQREAAAGLPGLRLRTEALSALPDEDHLWTRHPVQVDAGASRMTAGGMDYDNLARRLELQGRVVSVLAPRGRS